MKKLLIRRLGAENRQKWGGENGAGTVQCAGPDLGPENHRVLWMGRF